ncbi:MAG: hypothetical protein KAU27_03890, partial [Desulfuromonadales bacterium]|nr:hypothetical protein [Desulfuromonadales bacterium]
IDLVSGEGIHTVKRYYHFAPELSLQQDGAVFRVLGGTDRVITNLSLINVVQNNCQFDVQKGRLDKIQGWASERYAIKRPACVITATYNGGLPIELISVFESSGKVCEEHIDEILRTYNVSR